ncbi:hypothetical protein SAMN04489761_4266 [Tenacibaculum sp. MAR_2009_124]|uniref:hypothetical protein n=1 Tax=Tenacibaculum sp. MAR_2009_124 TaxID=1250059 RepID=UPI000896C588|nr:hypothetical protein [Tenacibaculum sp. MAR_2009_124]SED09812.1 hypothetical protein SAMN04489761_4266 [Tenacibaculum sp. MAR_2009_124]
MECVITDLNSVCNGCSYFNTNTNANNGYACSHSDCSDWVTVDNDGYTTEIENNTAIRLVAQSFTKRNIKCNRRLAKKFLKKARKSDLRMELTKIGVKTIGLCFSFTCPIAWSVDFEGMKNYSNSKEYDYIDNEDEMPSGFGDDLMGIEKSKADKLGITY